MTRKKKNKNNSIISNNNLNTVIEEDETSENETEINNNQEELLLEITKHKATIEELTQMNNNLQLQLEEKTSEYEVQIKLLTDRYTGIIEGKDMLINSLNNDIKKIHLDEEIKRDTTPIKDEVQIKKENMITLLTKMRMEPPSIQVEMPNSVVVFKEEVKPDKPVKSDIDKNTLLKQRRRMARL